MLGGILAAGAVLGFAMSKEGKEVSEALQDDAKALAKVLKKRLHHLEDVTKETFDELVATVVEEYAKGKELAIEAKDDLIAVLRGQWKAVENDDTAE